MLHQMKLWNKSFSAIKNGTKIVELRLNDEKRQEINKGDMICFTNTFTNATLNCAVVDKVVYSNFEELYQQYTPLSMGYLEGQEANPDDMLEYYTKEQIKQYGVVALILCSVDFLTPAVLVDYGICPTCFDRENNHCLYGDDVDKLIVSNSKFECFLVGNPRAAGHLVILSQKHYKDMIELPKDLCETIFIFAKKAMKVLKEVYKCKSVYLCTMCDGPMNHFHLQLIPRYAQEKRGSSNFVKPRKDYQYDYDKVTKLRKLLKED